MKMYTVTCLRQVKRCKYENLYTLPPTEGLLSAKIKVVASGRQDVLAYDKQNTQNSAVHSYTPLK